ncbi:uncharacterized protein LOC62_03G004146 [Vanrija pseudolonga]|uniref:CCZ1/INTU/HSP4 first Longin domain-containing protein n=1 Tax=Vanrija pseudolonga TaxID=143232 RepID=A0AAF0Y5T9_9TREE|nr:hypothetical protein LOC62_03G004146 [Vanrija pseudolonga]
MAPTPTALPPVPAALAHFVIFNPTLVLADDKPARRDNGPAAAAPAAAPPADPGERAREKELEDDLREAAQIVFYTSRDSGGVSRDKMLRQVGLAKGLIGFADMIAKDDQPPDEPLYWGVHSHKSRLIVYSPEPNWFMYICVTLALGPGEVTPAPAQKDNKDKDAKDAAPKEDTRIPLQSFSDRMLVDALQRGYEDFVLFHSTLSSHLPPTSAFSSLLEKFWTRFAFSFESEFIHPGSASPLQAWLGGFPPTNDELAKPLLKSLAKYAHRATIPEGSTVGIVRAEGPLTSIGYEPAPAEAAALGRYLTSVVGKTLPPPAVVTADTKTESRQSLGFSFGRKKHTRTETPPDVKPASPVAPEPRKTSWGVNLAWVGLGSGAPSASTTRAATPTQPVPVPIPAAGRIATEESVSASVSSSSSQKSRWPSLGLGGLGEAVGSMGAALGIGGKTAGEATPPRDSGEAKDDGEGARAADGEGGAGGDGKEAEGVKEAEGGKEAEAEPPIEPAQEVTVQADTPTETAEPEAPAIQAPPIDTAPSPLPAPTQPPEPTPTTDDPPDQDASAAASASQVSQTAVELSSLQDAVANHQIIEVPWTPKTVWLGQARRRLVWTVRDGSLVYVVFPDAEVHDLPSSTATMALHSKLPALLGTQASGDEPKPADPKAPPPNPTVYHAGQVTERSGGTLDSADSAILVDLRQALTSDTVVTAVYGQTPQNRFAVGKVVHTPASQELYLVTGKKDSSLTDAERAVRAYTYARPEFTS